MSRLLVEIERRWRSQFAALAAGDDVAPALRLRTEGMMEAAVLVEDLSERELLQRMQGIYAQAFGRTIDEDFGEDWTDLFAFPQIPGMARRAPVVPSTSD